MGDTVRKSLAAIDCREVFRGPRGKVSGQQKNAQCNSWGAWRANRVLESQRLSWKARAVTVQDARGEGNR